MELGAIQSTAGACYRKHFLSSIVRAEASDRITPLSANKHPRYAACAYAFAFSQRE